MPRIVLVLLATLFLTLPAYAHQRAMTIADMIAASDDYDTLKRLLTAAPDVAALLDDPSARLTFYAPTDAAFNGLFSDSMMTIEGFLRRPDQTDILLRRHIVPAVFDAASTEFLACDNLGTMMPSHWLLLERANDTLEINHSQVNTPARQAANGLLVPVNTVLPRFRLYPAASDHSPDGSGGTPPDPRLDATVERVPADRDVRGILSADGRFTRWLALLDSAPQVDGHLSGPGIYTLFVPIDTAFEADSPDADWIAETDSDFVANTVAPGYYTPDILLPDITFNQPDFCTLHPEGVIRTSDDNAGAYVDGVKLTDEVLYADNAVIYVVEGLRPPPFQG